MSIEKICEILTRLQKKGMLGQNKMHLINLMCLSESILSDFSHILFTNAGILSIVVFLMFRYYIFIVICCSKNLLLRGNTNLLLKMTEF